MLRYPVGRLSRLAAYAAVTVALLGGTQALAEEFACIAPATKSTVYRIVGGKAANPRDWPFIVGLFVNDTGPFCGGSLISPQWVLTASHCISAVSERQNQLNVRRVGSDLRASGDRTRVIKAITHPNYKNPESGSDVALLKLERPINTNGYAILASAQTEGTFGQPSTCVRTAGWGATREGGNVSRTLQEVDVPIVSNQNCRQMKGSEFNPDAHLCAGYPQGSMDSCQGDSGGPLVVPDAAPTGFLLIGVVSFGDGCARPRSPGVYSRVSTYRDWIFSTIDANK
jgi:secreted trypsin-like serine protease